RRKIGALQRRRHRDAAGELRSRRRGVRIGDAEKGGAARTLERSDGNGHRRLRTTRPNQPRRREQKEKKCPSSHLDSRGGCGTPMVATIDSKLSTCDSSRSTRPMYESVK